MSQCKSFVLKGGPQSGKTSLFREIEARYGQDVLVYPEVASVLLEHLWPTVDRDCHHHHVWVASLQRAIFHTQLGLEELARAQAETEGKRLIGQDRGVFDNAGYLGISGREIAALFDQSFEELMSRYDLVIHLDTLANIRPKEFGSATNVARYETPDEAIAVDERIWMAYDGHPNHVRIAATEDFDQKRDQVLSLIQDLLDN